MSLYVVTIDRPAGAPPSLPTQFQFEAPDNASAEDLQRLANEAVRSRLGPSGYYSETSVNYDIYLDRDGNIGTANDRDRLGLDGGHRAAWRAGLSRFRMPMAARAGDRVISRVEIPSGVDIPPELRASLENLRYTADGNAPLGDSERLSFLADLERILRPYPNGQELLTRILGGNSFFGGGVDGNGRESLQSLYGRYNIETSQFGQRNQEWWNQRVAGNANPTATAPGSAGADPSAVTDYINHPTRANFDRIDRERARLDQLIAMLMAALGAGNLDVLPSLMSVIQQKSGLTVAQIASVVAENMGRNDTERRAVSDRLVAAQGGSTTGGSGSSSGGRPNAANVTRENLNLQQVNQNAEMWARMLQTVQSGSENMSQTISNIIAGFERLRRAQHQ